MEDPDSITLPDEPEAIGRGRVPLIASVVPMMTGVVMWAVTGSILALSFAALGPVMMLAGVFDGRLVAKRQRRKALTESDQLWADAEAALAARHRQLRADLWRANPGVWLCLRDEQPRGDSLSVRTQVVLGSGELVVSHHTRGGNNERATQFRRRASRLARAPVTVAFGTGIEIRAPLSVALAFARALCVQLCARFGPSDLALVGVGVTEIGLSEISHAKRPDAAALRLVVVVEPRSESSTDSVIRIIQQADAATAPSVVIDASDPVVARVRTTDGEQTLCIEGISCAQAVAIASGWKESGQGDKTIPERIGLADLPAIHEGLSAAIGQGEAGDVVVDLIADGPHAIVTGMTGSGKSELLVTWVTSLARNYASSEVTFVLADFKGGTAFDALAALPHVTAVITDLDGEGTRRGVESLRAELRSREASLAKVGARDVTHPEVRFARLVIVVDEFAALVNEHPELAEVFTDIAARGRALGMHLILGTQRASGVMRDALLANCPLRLSLRVADAADSRAVVGFADASELPGDASGLGLAVLRRPRDARPQRFRVARTTSDDIESVADARSEEPIPHAPWLPPLPDLIELSSLDAGADPSGLALGLVDDPAHQRQQLLRLTAGVERGLLVLGGPASGKSSALALLAAQHPGARVIPADLEETWDAVAECVAAPSAGLIVCDDIDAALSGFPPDYAQEYLHRWEQLIRSASSVGVTVVLSAHRLSAPVARLAELLPRRLVLGYPNRTDYIAAGGDAINFRATAPPGRGHIDGQLIQCAQASAGLMQPATPSSEWNPDQTTAIIAAHPALLIESLQKRHPQIKVVSVSQYNQSDTDSKGTVLVVGDGDAWQRDWALWQRFRETADVLVLAECASELRTLVGIRELPPFARTHEGRGWLLQAGRQPRRVTGLDLLPRRPATS